MLVKLAFQRARPAFDDPLLTLATYSFPSGHVAGSTIFYGLRRRLGVRADRGARAGALPRCSARRVAIALVAFSRMYLGVHYLSDVAAAFAEGVAWLAICASARLPPSGATAPDTRLQRRRPR